MEVSVREIEELTKEAYIYGLDQAVFYETRFAFTQLEAAPVYAGVNALTFADQPSGADDRAGVTPNRLNSDAGLTGITLPLEPVSDPAAKLPFDVPTRTRRVLDRPAPKDAPASRQGPGSGAW